MVQTQKITLQAKALGLAIALMTMVMMLASPVFATDEEKAAKPDATQADKEAPAEETPDPFVVPDGTPEELVDYIKSLKKMQPEVRDRASMFPFIKKAGPAMITAADKIFDSSDATEEQINAAFEAKMQGLGGMMQTRNPKAFEMLEAFHKQLEVLKKPVLARKVKTQLLNIEVTKAARKLPGAKPLKEVVAEVESFIGDKPDRASFSLVMKITSVLGRVDKKEAVSFCNKYVKLFAASDDPSLVKQSEALAGLGRRLDLVGNPMKVVGKTLDGSEFDWATYKGKVVLVQFWATWCAPCRREIPAILVDYKKYHDKGFDVVAISLDRDLAKLEKYTEDEELPWTVIYNGPREEGEKREAPNATYYGVRGIPELILVGSDGNVIATGLRGKMLTLELEKIFGVVEEETEEAEEAEETEETPADE